MLSSQLSIVKMILLKENQLIDWNAGSSNDSDVIILSRVDLKLKFLAAIKIIENTALQPPKNRSLQLSIENNLCVVWCHSFHK